MGRTPRDITEAELAVMRTLWSRGPATIRALAEALYEGASTSAYATVQKLLERLEDKGAVERSRAVSPHVFSARLEREDLIERRLRDVADQLCGGSLTPLLTQLVRGTSLSAEEREALRALVAGRSPRRPGTPEGQS